MHESGTEKSRKAFYRILGRTDQSLRCLLGANRRSGGDGFCGIWSSKRVPTQGGGTHKGETAEAERGEAQPAGGGTHSSNGADQPTGKHD